MMMLTKWRARAQHGFTLIEIMVGVAVGLLGIVVIFQMASVFEGRKRTTGTGSDAQIAGSIAMFSLERDVRLAGYGFGTATYTGCNVTAYDSNRPATNFTFGLYPVQIIDGAAGAPDTLAVLYGNSTAVVSTQTFLASPTTSTKKTQSRGGLRRGELLVLYQLGSAPAQCALVEITDDSDPDTLTISHSNQSYVNYLGQNVTSRYNIPGGVLVPALTQGGISDLGLSPRLNTWQIRNGKTLAWSDGLHYVDSDGDGQNDWSEVADGIINLQAQYGVDTNNNGMIDTGEWTNATPANWSKVLGIRVAILARSQEYEKSAVTTVAPSWAGGAFTMTNVDGTADSTPGDPNDWRHYRYRVYQTVVPLRNIIWGTAP